MKIRYTIKIKDEHNAPEFKKGMGKGVVAIQDCVYKTIESDEDFKSTSFQRHIFEFSKELLEQWFEVVPEIIDVKKERKEKLKEIEEKYNDFVI